jgi:hypothetical protein
MPTDLKVSVSRLKPGAIGRHAALSGLEAISRGEETPYLAV